MIRSVQFLLLALAALLLGSTGLAQNGESVASGFNGPMGLLVDDEGNLWVIDSGTGGDQTVSAPSPETGGMIEASLGETARVVRVSPDGSQTEIATLPSIAMGMEVTGGARLAQLGDDVYATSGFWVESAGERTMPLMGTVVRVDESGATSVADLWQFEVEQNPDGFIVESHPYGIAAGPDGALYVADAGANTLLRVDPESGAVELVTTFPGLPAELPPGVPGNPNRGGAPESDPVPTGIVVNEDGSVLVALLPGFPFTPGSSRVVSVSSEGEISEYATGLTMVTDLQRAPNGDLFAVSFGQFTEQGPQPGSGAIVRVEEGNVTPVIEGLVFPTGIAFDSDGNAYVTVNGVGAPGSGEILRFDGLAGN